jgi:hypothetical protein
MTLAMKSFKKKKILQVRTTVTLAKATLTRWLGAYTASSPPLLLCPWDVETLADSFCS